MKKCKFKRIGRCLILIVLVTILFSNVHADINQEYYENNLGAFKVAETKANLIAKTIMSVLLDAIGQLVYALASLGEWLLGIIFQAASSGAPEQNNIFPWADAIIFNAIPFLDVNFINPYSGGGTVVGLIQDVIKSVYGTIFGLAISFFSIAVLIMGIKLAVSTIASEKAKYKQAIWDWLLGLILLFTIHFLISFVFYLNEQLVIKASVIAADAMNASSLQVVMPDNSEICTNFINAMRSFDVWRTFVAIVGIAAFVVGCIVTGGGVAIGSALAGALALAGTAGVVAATNEISQAWEATFDGMSNDQVDKYICDNADVAAALLKNEEYVKIRLGSNLYSPEAWAAWTGDKDPSALSRLAADIAAMSSDNVSSGETKTDGELFIEANKKIIAEYNSLSNSEKQTYKNDYIKASALVDAYSYHLKSNDTSAGVSLIANLSQYFKEAAWTYGNNSWKTDKLVIQNAIMYAILVVQSFIFLIAYVKRLFYVIILAMLAPAVVVYDFFNKSMS